MKIRVPLCLFHIETSIKRAYQSESLFHYHPNATIKSKTSPAENYALPYSFYSFADNKTLSSNWGLFILQLRATQPPTEKRSFAGGITAFSLKQKRKKKGANGD